MIFEYFRDKKNKRSIEAILRETWATFIDDLFTNCKKGKEKEQNWNVTK